MKKAIKKFAFSISAIALVFLPLAVLAETVVVENYVKTSASTGDNSSENSSTGVSSSHVEIKTVVNGEVLENISETVISTSGQNAIIEKRTEARVNSTSKVSTTEENPMGQPVGQKSNIILSFISKIFNYVFSLFTA